MAAPSAAPWPATSSRPTTTKRTKRLRASTPLNSSSPTTSATLPKKNKIARRSRPPNRKQQPQSFPQVPKKAAPINGLRSKGSWPARFEEGKDGRSGEDEKSCHPELALFAGEGSAFSRAHAAPR